MGVRFIKGINSSNKFRFLRGSNASEKIKFLKTIATSIVEPTTNGLVARFKADAGITESSGVITSWADQSGGAGVATAYNGPTLITNQLNGRPAVNFNGIDQYFTFNLNSAINANNERTYIVIYKYNSMVDQNGILDSFLQGDEDHPNTRAYMFQYNGSLYYNDGSQIGTAIGNFTTNYFIQTITNNIDSGTLRINGIDKASGALIPPQVQNFTIGCRGYNSFSQYSEFADANIVEILIYNRKLSNLEIQEIETYANVLV